MNITCLFCIWPYSCIWLRNNVTDTKSSKDQTLTELFKGNDAKFG